MNGLRTHNALLRAAQRRSDADGYPLRDNASAGAFWAVCGGLIVLVGVKATPWLIAVAVGVLAAIGLAGAA